MFLCDLEKKSFFFKKTNILRREKYQKKTKDLRMR